MGKLSIIESIRRVYNALNDRILGKQDTITDLDDIRSGAAVGSNSEQSRDTEWIDLEENQQK